MKRLGAVLTLAASVALAGCGGVGAGSGDAETLRVYAASSLTGAFGELERRFEQDHEGIDVELTLGGSADLVAQVDQGAPADVVATADEVTMARLVAADLAAAEPQPFATSRLQLAVPPDNPAGIGSIADLARPGVQLVICAPEVPCGAAAQDLAQAVGVELAPVSEEQSVAGVLTKVANGEADAGLVYVTDVAAAGDDVEGIAVPESGEVVNVYPIAPVAGAAQPEAARDFVDLVVSARGRQVLRELGFGAP